MGQGQDASLIRGRTSFFNVSPGSDFRGSVTYGAPARTGSRWPNVTSLVSSAGYDTYRSAMVSGVGSDAAGFDWVCKGPDENSGDVSVAVQYFTIWGGE